MRDVEIEGRRQPCCSVDIEMRFFHPPREEELRRPSPSDRSSRSLVDSCPRPSFLPQSFPTSSPEDEKCIKHYRHSVSCGGQYPPIERLSSLHSRFSTCVRVFPLLPRLWKTPAENESDYVSSFLTRLRWDLSRPSCPSILITLISFAANFFRNVLPLNLFAFAKKKISFLLFLKFLIT